MISKAIRVATILVATLGILVAILAAALPASAATSGSMCETNGNNYCLNTANFDLYTPVTESGSGARTINAVVQNASQHTYLLQFNGDISKCVASDNNGYFVEVKACSGSNGVIWTSAGSGMWINNYATARDHYNVYLTGYNQAGNQYSIKPDVSGDGYYQKFTFK